jgi:hypothetical protein
MRRTLLFVAVLVTACSREPSETKQVAAPASTSHLGEAISSSAQAVSLAQVVKNPEAYKGKPLVTTGTVTAVCQSMGCWMELKDDAGEAHVKMAGEKFFVPKTSAGHHARVQATLVDVTGGDEECAHEAAEQTGKQVAKLQLEATGVELD